LDHDRHFQSPVGLPQAALQPPGGGGAQDAGDRRHAERRLLERQPCDMSDQHLRQACPPELFAAASISAESSSSSNRYFVQI
jgi:hypothetical protein